MSDEPVMARKGPFGKVVKKGETYWWCSCGRSQTQPFCDGSHQGTEFKPVRFVPEDSGMVAFCGCKQTRCVPWCDDSHIAIVVEKDEVDEFSKPRIVDD